jgi:hypothetical protein
MSGSGNIEINCSNNLIARYLFRRHRIKGDPKPKTLKAAPDVYHKINFIKYKSCFNAL